MAYIKYKELTKFFDFSKYIEIDKLPWYIFDYVYENEKILVSYKTFRDHGIFTTEKIVLFDNSLSIKPFKKIYTIPYNSVSSCSILFRPRYVCLQFDLESGYQLVLKFVNMSKIDKARLRILYSHICRYITGQKHSNEVLNTLIENKIIIKED